MSQKQEWYRLTGDEDPQPNPYDVRKFVLCWYGTGVVVQETDGAESYRLHHGPFPNAKVAMSAIKAILKNDAISDS